MSTYNRGKLLRLAKAGKLVAIVTYQFDDMYGADTIKTNEMPVVIRTKENKDIYQAGICYLREDLFKSYGHATLNPNKTVHLHVHSNKYYDFKIID